MYRSEVTSASFVGRFFGDTVSGEPYLFCDTRLGAFARMAGGSYRLMSKLMIEWFGSKI